MKIALEDRLDEFQDRVIARRNLADLSKDIPGWGMDADPENDPTYPMKHYNGADHERFDYEKAPQQIVDIEVFHSIERPGVTRVFGTSTPPSGVSGAIRRYAYKFSEATATHWMTLILADRVGAIEGKLSDLAKGILPNPWIERGWKAEWKHNRPAFLGKAVSAALFLTAATLLMSGKKKRHHLH